MIWDIIQGLSEVSIEGIPVGKLPNGEIVYMAYGEINMSFSSSTSLVNTTFAHGVSNVKTICSFTANMISASGAIDYPLPYINDNGAVDTFVKTVDKNNITISNRTSWSANSYVLKFVMYYTKVVGK